ncbi:MULTISPECIES: AraC family transcriptional regulator [unclassified Spirosoma]|uniref:helix-turn-helix domain-containing protein n=1 Tax=unclassified Spirosoma TaxID=2621999 RepID=UPI000959D731|nr:MULTISPECIES: AraC family transcriptional regulator [unclassified Spirosoma]MBN8825698.1 helix-turn-helix domain-containing protein [Spirosoma sp.]OJW76608.1 MAG: hypothetical protein BGO59_05995 [Spirosoma sp. 48-14]
MDPIPVRHTPSDVSHAETSDGFVVRKLDKLLAGQGMIQPLHRHGFYFMLVIEKGSGEHSIDFSPYPVGDGCVFIVRPGQVHALTLATGGQGFLAQFPDDFLHKDPLKKVSKTNYYQPNANSFERILSFMKAIYWEISEKNSQYQQAIQLTLQLLFIELLRQEKSPRTTADSANIYSQERLEAFQELIADHFTEQKQVSWYARQLNLSAYQLNAITKATLDKTASAIINEYILLEAKRYVLATSSQINQISWQLGYDDVSYFIRFFKKHTGYSPEAFRVKFNEVP